MNYYSLMKPYFDEMRLALIRFVSINSVYDEKSVSKSTPFGKGVDNALKFVADLGLRYGFDVDYCDGYCIELSIGDGDKLIGIYAHADVVPASGEWDNPPFSPIIKNGKIYGRGTSDDKGPLIAAFYALKALKDNGLLKGYKVKLVVGGDEERGSACLDYYFNILHKPYPDYGFTPDSDFPLIYGEKGIIDFYPSIKVGAENIISIKGGVATNAVCDKVSIKLCKDDGFTNYLKSQKVNFSIENDEIIIYGKSAHGSTPELGVNAALIALKTLGDFYKIEKFSQIAEKLLITDGSSFGGKCETKLLGKTTYCVGLINYQNGVLTFSVNFRHPENVDPNEYINHFDEYFLTHSESKEPSPVLLYNPKSKLVKTLLNAYRKETNDKTPPLTTGGGTYAKHAKNTIAFGALFPHDISTMHEPNEYMILKEFELASVIYAHAINDLGKLD